VGASPTDSREEVWGDSLFYKSAAFRRFC